MSAQNPSSPSPVSDRRPHHAHWPKRLPHAITPPQTSLWMNLAISAQRYPDKPALAFLGEVMSYAELARQAERMAAFLHSLGVEQGDRVILDMQNSPQLVVAHFAILRANAVVVPVNPMNRAEELKHYITDPDVKVAITTGDLAPELARASNALPAPKRLLHLIVTQFTDAFDPGTAGDDAPPEAWSSWLQTRHPLPALEGGQVHDWSEVLLNAHVLPEVIAGPDDLAALTFGSVM